MSLGPEINLKSSHSNEVLILTDGCSVLHVLQWHVFIITGQQKPFPMVLVDSETAKSHSSALLFELQGMGRCLVKRLLWKGA